MFSDYSLLQLLTGGNLECVFHYYTGLPCPTCGGTRAMLCLLQGDLFTALCYNPGVVVGVPLFGAYLLWGFVRARRAHGRWPRGPQVPAGRWLALATVLGNWAYLLADAPV